MTKSNILFVVSGYYFNGGTTFLLRILCELNKKGIGTGVLFLKREGDEDLLEQISRVSDVRFLITSKLSKMVFPLPLIFSLGTPLRKWAQSYSHVHVMGFFPFLKSLDLVAGQGMSIGVYQQDEYISERFDEMYIQKLLHNFIKIKKPMFLFFNEDNKKRYSSKFSLKDECCILTPIGVGGSSVTLSKNINKLVSVGNLMAFKTYFKNTIKVIAELKKLGRYYCYDIYGDGPEKESLEKLVNELDVADLVVFRGNLLYSELYETLSSYKALVGSGTVVIEAAMVGTPSIIGIENENDLVTYGLLSEFKGLSYNEKGLDLPTIPLKDSIDNIMSLDMDGVKYAGLQKSAMRRSSDFSIERTAEAFQQLIHLGGEVTLVKFSVLTKAKIFFSLLNLCIHAVLFQSSFSDRKQQ